MTDITRSSSLNNIPRQKLMSEISTLIKSCPTCKELEIKVDQSLEVGLCDKCRIFITAFNRYYESNIPIQYWHLTMEKHFKGFAGLLSKYKEYTLDLKKMYGEGISLCFAGSHGVGKTMACNCILKKACQKGYQCLYSDLSSIISVLTQAPPEEKFLARKELCMSDFLIIDEVDHRFFNGSEATNDLYIKNLENIFRTRAQNNLPTLLCTNSPNLVESFQGALKQSMQSLIKGNITVIPVIGQDYRTK